MLNPSSLDDELVGAFLKDKTCIGDETEMPRGELDLTSTVKNLLGVFTVDDIIKEARKQERQKVKSTLVASKSVEDDNYFGSIYGELIDPTSREALIKIIDSQHKTPQIEALIREGQFSLQKRKTSCGRCSKCTQGLWCSYDKRIRMQGKVKANILIPRDFRVKLMDGSFRY